MIVQDIINKHRDLHNLADDYWVGLKTLRGETTLNLNDVERDMRPSVRAMLKLYKEADKTRREFLLTEVTLNAPED
jgi:hypothetical protein